MVPKGRAVVKLDGAAAAVALIAGALLLTGCAPAAEKPAAERPAAEGAPTVAADATTCAAPAEWFPASQTTPPDPNIDFDSFCKFHQWAWQSFLYLTQTEDGGALRFETFPTNHDVVTGTRAEASGGLKLKVRGRKTDDPDDPFDAINQAGRGGVLVDQNGRAVYYSQYVNDAMFDEIVQKSWNDPAILETIPPQTVFATGDVELKVSWKILSGDDDPSGFFARKATIDKLINTDDGIKPDPASQLEVAVALVGFHVVGWVNGHSEAIWATFEHNDNAPDFAANQSPSAPVSDRNWTFYAANTPAIDCNQASTTDMTLDEATQVLSPVTQACRQYPFGMAADTPPDDGNLKAIQELNRSVREQLEAGSTLRNYFEVGAIWTNPQPPPLEPDSSLQDVLVGSTLLSNATIETFTQTVRSENNCFSCHNTEMYNPTDFKIAPLQGTNLNLSHIILEAYVENQ